MAVEEDGLAPYLHWVQGQFGVKWYDVTHITTPPFNTSNAKTIKKKLQQHGCQIEEYPEYHILTFPPGTQKKLIAPVTLVERYTVRFPDGYEIRQEFDRARGISLLFIPKD